jgi:hypothetical protein
MLEGQDGAGRMNVEAYLTRRSRWGQQDDTFMEDAIRNDMLRPSHTTMPC